MGHRISSHSSEAEPLKAAIRRWGAELGFGAIGFAGIEQDAAEARLLDWLARGYHGEMDYMARHGTKRARPAELIPGTRSVITARLDYLPAEHEAEALLEQAERAYISRYALGRDYHKVVRNKLQKLAGRIEAEVGPFGYRVFTDSAPVLEVELAAQSSLGWRGKHTLLIDRRAGSWFFLGEIYCELTLPPDPPEANHCGSCQACIDICPTQAIVAPYEVDARRCISYLTIELAGSIPIELRPLLGNRIYGCDDCQLACPWNRFAQPTREADFAPRNGLDSATLIELFAWTETEFETRLAGSPIRRIGFDRWLRNIAVALGNAPASPGARAALAARLDHPSPLVREHVQWALTRQTAGAAGDQ
ncbi:MAG: tRNA epoxyqueuosine(34) reductase QueG [Hydrogenophilaceae bacterium]|nr:tRNA epoxyqueuosine(34) reductase QueG [Hydrogenophilaceae bacterium]